jgi:hypothetical protein
LFQTVRELLQNVVKHARSKRATVRCSTNREQLMLDVLDPGVGFEVQSLNRLPTRPADSACSVFASVSSSWVATSTFIQWSAKVRRFVSTYR